jgi:hypothetical protein
LDFSIALPHFLPLLGGELPMEFVYRGRQRGEMVNTIIGKAVTHQEPRRIKHSEM